MARGHKRSSARRRKSKERKKAKLQEFEDIIRIIQGNSMACNHQVTNSFAKKWPSEFSKRQGFRQEKFYVDTLRSVDAASEGISLFLDDQNEPVSFLQAEEMKRFLQGAKLLDLTSAVGTAGHRRAAWLDDRSSACTHCKTCPTLFCLYCTRYYENPLTATAMHRYMKKPQFGMTKSPDVHRRLTYFLNLDPNYALSLAETVEFRQHSGLRDAIQKHIASQISIGVTIPKIGVPVVLLEFHLPYLALRKSSTKAPNTINAPTRRSTDISFLDKSSFETEKESSNCIHEAHFSLVIDAYSDRQWIAYAFDKTSSDEKNDLKSQIFPCEDDVHMDPISEGEIHANYPIWDPREYFLLIVSIRSQRILKEWKSLVHTVELSVKADRNKHSSLLSESVETDDHEVEDSRKTFDRTELTIELLRYLLDCLSGTVTAWEGFSSDKGDIQYFLNTDSDTNCNGQKRLDVALQDIKDAMEKMTDLHKKLARLNDSCRESAKTLKLRLQIEANTAVESSAQMTYFTVIILAPVSMTIAYFSIPQSSIPFKLEAKYFPVVSIFIIGIIQLLFTTICALPSWWKKIQPRLKVLTFKRLGEVFERASWAGKGRKINEELGEAAVVV